MQNIFQLFHSFICVSHVFASIRALIATCVDTDKRYEIWSCYDMIRCRIMCTFDHRFESVDVQRQKVRDKSLKTFSYASSAPVSHTISRLQTLIELY